MKDRPSVQVVTVRSSYMSKRKKLEFFEKTGLRHYQGKLISSSEFDKEKQREQEEKERKRNEKESGS